MPIPRTLMDAPLPAALDLRLAAGTWPDGLGGEVFVSGSDRATAPKHAFFGDGWLLRLSLDAGTHGAPPDRFALRGNVIDTPSRRLREARPDVFEGRAFGTSSPFGFSNSANTAPLPWGDRLFATWDAGRPVEVDPVSLTFLGEVGHRDSWGPDTFDSPVLPLLGSSAHPVVDPERGCLWTVVSNPITSELAVIRWDPDATEVRRWPLDGVALPQSMHTVGQTRDWLVLVDCAFRVDPNEVLGLGERSITNLTDEPMFLVRKDTLEATAPGTPVAPTVVRTGPETNHYYAVWDDTDGVRLLLEHTVDTDLAMYLRDDDVDAWGRPVDARLRGLYNHPMHHGVASELLVDPTHGTVAVEARYEEPARSWATQLSAMDWSTEGLAAPDAHHLLFTGFRPDGITRRSLELYAGRVDPARFPVEEVPGRLVTLARGGLVPKASWDFALDDYATSPVLVPRPGGRPGGLDGWVVVPVLNDDGFRVDVFDAAAVGAGPLATLRPPAGEALPFLVHSAWAPRAVPHDPGLPRLRFGDELDAARLASLDDDLAAAARAVADDLTA